MWSTKICWFLQYHRMDWLLGDQSAPLYARQSALHGNISYMQPNVARRRRRNDIKRLAVLRSQVGVGVKLKA